MTDETPHVFAKSGQSSIVKEINAGFANMGSELISSKIKERELLEESAAAGGPSSAFEAVLNILDVCKIGVRELAVKSNTKRLKVKAMLEGRADIPPEMIALITEIAMKRRPDLFKD